MRCAHATNVSVTLHACSAKRSGINSQAALAAVFETWMYWQGSYSSILLLHDGS